jgi:hypothetical protein
VKGRGEDEQRGVCILFCVWLLVLEIRGFFPYSKRRRLEGKKSKEKGSVAFIYIYIYQNKLKWKGLGMFIFKIFFI